MLLEVHNWSEVDATVRRRLLARPAMAAGETIRDGVKEIIARVRRDGDEGLLQLTRELDQAKLENLRVTPEERDEAAEMLDSKAVDAIDYAIENVRRFHERQLPLPISMETRPGVTCERVSHPVDSVGLYVPAGTAPLPSAAIMLAVPAAVAGCPVRVMCTPPTGDGKADPAVITAAARAGVTEVFKIGGAQAIAAMGYGTLSVPKVCKIFGPGNAWVTCAKTLVSADADGTAIDMPAGPSEVLVIADESANAEFVAADLLSQAEHGEDSQVLLVTTSQDFARSVQAETERQLADLPRAKIARAALRVSRAIVVDSLNEAVDVSNRYGPEHLILQCREARSLLQRVRNAGSIFVGAWAPESVGDYCSGTNHVLPTYGHARSYSGLGVEQFMRHMTIQELTREGLEELAPAVTTLAELEGLDAHAAAVRRRLRVRV
jgi:histidinol dehydrogenase